MNFFFADISTIGLTAFIRVHCSSFLQINEMEKEKMQQAKIRLLTELVTRCLDSIDKFPDQLLVNKRLFGIFWVVLVVHGPEEFHPQDRQLRCVFDNLRSYIKNVAISMAIERATSFTDTEIHFQVSLRPNIKGIKGDLGDCCTKKVTVKLQQGSECVEDAEQELQTLVIDKDKKAEKAE